MKLPGFSSGTSRRVRALLACGILLGTGAVGTTALWSTTAATTSGTFKTAGVEIQVGPSGGSYQASYAFTFPNNLLPGSTTAAIVQVKNTGGIPFTYSSAVTGANAGLSTTLVARRATASPVSIAGGTYSDDKTCSGGESMTAGIGVATGSQTFSTTSGTLAAAAVQDICLQVTLSMSTPGTYAGLTNAGTVTVTFTATAAP